MNIDRTTSGYLLNNLEWTPEVMKIMAADDGFSLTDEIVNIINKLREMYHNTGIVPSKEVFNRKHKIRVCDHVGEKPMDTLAKYSGLPEGSGCS